MGVPLRVYAPERPLEPFEKIQPFARVPLRACKSSLSDAAYRVLGALMGHCFGDTTELRASNQELARECGKSLPAIQRSLAELERNGWIQRLALTSSKRTIALSFRLPSRQKTLALADPETTSTTSEVRPSTTSEVRPNHLRSEAQPPQKRGPTTSETRGESEEEFRTPRISQSGPPPRRDNAAGRREQTRNRTAEPEALDVNDAQAMNQLIDWSRTPSHPWCKLAKKLLEDSNRLRAQKEPAEGNAAKQAPRPEGTPYEEPLP
jgi:DNA-binding MarR family transcriptional regulator